MNGELEFYRVVSMLEEQPPQKIALMCSSLLFDMHRYSNFNALTKRKQAELLERTKSCAELLKDFLSCEGEFSFEIGTYSPSGDHST